MSILSRILPPSDPLHALRFHARDFGLDLLDLKRTVDGVVAHVADDGEEWIATMSPCGGRWYGTLTRRRTATTEASFVLDTPDDVAGELFLACNDLS